MRSLVRWWLLLALVALPALAQKSEEEAGDVSEADKDASGPLRERIPPVSGHLFLMDGRFEVSPGIGLSVRDAFFSKVFFGAALTYHEHVAAGRTRLVGDLVGLGFRRQILGARRIG